MFVLHVYLHTRAFEHFSFRPQGSGSDEGKAGVDVGWCELVLRVHPHISYTRRDRKHDWFSNESVEKPVCVWPWELSITAAVWCVKRHREALSRPPAPPADPPAAELETVPPATGRCVAPWRPGRSAHAGSAARCTVGGVYTQHTHSAPVPPHLKAGFIHSAPGQDSSLSYRSGRRRFKKHSPARGCTLRQDI